ncbi:MAG: protease modulator HflC [Deltaproteobacteria bacterium]|nr:protease modulator HflC [Deltaproteobacteria bacterium]
MKKIIFIIFLILGLVVVSSSYFVVNETEQVVITRFGAPVRNTIQKAGIYFKAPIVEQANFFEKRILEWDGEASKPIPTRDKKNIIIDATARWRITNPLVFLQSVGSMESAQSRLDDIIDSNVRDIVSKHSLVEIVRNSNRVINIIQQEYESESFAAVQDEESIIREIKDGRDQITRDVLKKSQPIIEKYGIKLIDVRIKGLIYSKVVLENVFRRMTSQYQIKAQNLRSEGDRKKSEIQGETEFELKEIESGAYKQAQIIRGEGDAEAARIYAETLSVDPDFYQFQRSLEAYQEAIKENAVLLMGTESEFFRVLKTGK